MCVNPEHLWLGTDLDNKRDCIAKGRDRKGDHTGPRLRKLTDEQVLAIVQAPGMLKDIAIKYGTSINNVSNIKRGLRKRRVTGIRPQHKKVRMLSAT